MDLTGRAAPAFRPPRGRHDRREPPPVVAEQPLEAPGVGEAPPACSWSGLGRGAPGWPRGRGRSPRASWPHRGGARRMAPPVTYQSRSKPARPQSSSGPSSQPGSAPPRRRGRGPYWRPARRRGRELPPGWCAELPGGGAVPRARAAGPRAAAGRLAESPARGPRTPETRRARSSAPPATRPSVASSVPWGARRRPIRPVGAPGPDRAAARRRDVHRAAPVGGPRPGPSPSPHGTPRFQRGVPRVARRPGAVAGPVVSMANSGRVDVSSTPAPARARREGVGELIVAGPAAAPGARARPRGPPRPCSILDQGRGPGRRLPRAPSRAWAGCCGVLPVARSGCRVPGRPPRAGPGWPR